MRDHLMEEEEECAPRVHTLTLHVGSASLLSSTFLNGANNQWQWINMQNKQQNAIARDPRTVIYGAGGMSSSGVFRRGFAERGTKPLQSMLCTHRQKQKEVFCVLDGPDP